MKTFMLMGGLVGFVIGLVSGWFGAVSWPVLLCRSSVAALAAGLLMRWWWRVCVRSLHQKLLQDASEDAVTEPPAAKAGARS